MGDQILTHIDRDRYFLCVVFLGSCRGSCSWSHETWKSVELQTLPKHFLRRAIYIYISPPKIPSYAGGYNPVSNRFQKNKIKFEKKNNFLFSPQALLVHIFFLPIPDLIKYFHEKKSPLIYSFLLACLCYWFSYQFFIEI